jgi:uncharacterized membrane protein
MTLLPIHITAGALGIISGFVALFAFKGARLHRKSGMFFVYVMTVMGVSGATLAVLKHDWSTSLGGLLSVYLVITGLRTIRRPVPGVPWVDVGAMLFGLALVIAYLTFGLQASRSATGTKDGYPAMLFFVFGSVTWLATVGDLRMLRVGSLQGARRLSRHLWRMCLALLIATGSFFLGQARVIPKPIRIMPLLAAPVLLVLVMMLYWLVRVRFAKRIPHHAGDPGSDDSVHLVRAERAQAKREGAIVGVGRAPASSRGARR